jgi:signal transduction histidine kinase
MKSAKSNNPGKSVIQTNYDIVTKGHGGQMKVETEMGKGSKFIIMLPAIILEQ